MNLDEDVTGLTTEECAVVVGCSPQAWRDRTRRGVAPPARQVCPRSGRRLWDPAEVFGYRARAVRPAPAEQHAAMVRSDGGVSVRMLAWAAEPPPSRGRGFPPDAWRARRSERAG